MDDIVCPNCGSHNYSYRKKGYNWGLGILGFLFFHFLGLLFGLIGKNKVIFHCNDCDEEWSL